MGLSNEERYEKIVFNISHVNDLIEDMKSRMTAHLKSLANQLWYEFLKKESDSGLWIMGCDLASGHLGSGLLTAAFSCHVPNGRDSLEDMERDLRKKDKFFDSYKTLSAFVEMERLLEREKRAVMLTYATTQSISYALCRYHDKFMKQYKGLNFLIRQMQGECFKLMKRDRDYTYAWMVHHLCEQVYSMDDKDIVNQWWTKQCIPHDIKLRWNKYKEVFEAFKKHQFKKLTIQERIDLTFLLVAEKYGEYENEHKEFLTMVETYNKVKTNKVKIDVKAIEEAFVKSKAMKKDAEHHSNTRCEFTGNYINNKGEVCNWMSS